jgi:hypothetical protein
MIMMEMKMNKNDPSMLRTLSAKARMVTTECPPPLYPRVKISILQSAIVIKTAVALS